MCDFLRFDHWFLEILRVKLYVWRIILSHLYTWLTFPGLKKFLQPLWPNEPSQLFSTEALGPKLVQHTQITWRAQLKCDMHAKVGRWRLGWYYMFVKIMLKQHLNTCMSGRIFIHTKNTKKMCSMIFFIGSPQRHL